MDNYGNGSLFRYWHEREDADGQQLIWPGGPGGFPMRGEPRTLTQDEYDNLQLSYTARIQTFDLSNAADLEAYRSIIEKASNNYFIIRYCKRIENQAGEVVRAYIEWLEPAYTVRPSVDMPLPREGQTYAVSGPNAIRDFFDQTEHDSVVRLAGVAPGMQLEQGRRY